jgi:glycosyltransferase involved in cell wall biosynthesis
MFEKMADDLGVRQFCEFTGLISKPMDLRQRLIDADIMVFPTKGEGLPRCIIEAMAVGLPCLSTPVNGIPELLSEDCLFNQQDVDAFALKCIGLLQSNDWNKKSNENHIKSHEFAEVLINERRIKFYEALAIVK